MYHGSQRTLAIWLGCDRLLDCIGTHWRPGARFPLIRPSEQQTFGQRIALTVAIVIVILLALAFIGWISGGWDEAPAFAEVASAGKPATSRPEWDARMLELDRVALEQAYTQHLTLIWRNWMVDGGPPIRHQTGFAKARNGYIASMQAIEQRESK